MYTPFEAWLRALAAARQGPVSLPTATRELPYRAVIAINADYSSSTIEAQVRASPSSTSALAVFGVSSPVYDGDVTTFSLSLASGTGPNSTGSLPTDGTGEGIDYLPFDIIVTPFRGQPERLLGGLLPVSGFITLPAS